MGVVARSPHRHVIGGERADPLFLGHAFQAQGIGFRNFWRPLHQQAPYREENTDFPHAIEVAGKGLWLPSSFHIAEGEVKEIAEYVGLALS